MDERSVVDSVDSGRRLLTRPRLVQLLGDSAARISLLTAPAGYGKTTLARQWISECGRRAVWYRATAVAGDVAALARGMREAFAPLLDLPANRLQERLRTSTDPERDAVELADLLAKDISAVPEDVQLIFDDYHHLVGHEAAEAFVSSFVDNTTMPVLIASRVRPSWVSAKSLLYGEVLELGRHALAMTHDEAAAVLNQNREERGLSGLVALADGWPAVIGLAALLPDPLEVSIQAVPDSLHSFFAEELYQGMSGELQWEVAQLSLASSVTAGLARDLFGTKGIDTLNEAHNRGFLSKDADTDPATYELHPLLRQYLRQKLDEFDQFEVQQSARRMGHWYLARSDWDAAFALAYEFSDAELLRPLIVGGIDQILAEGRLSTVDQWLDLGHRVAPADPVVRLAEVEAAFRRRNLAGRRGQRDSSCKRLAGRSSVRGPCPAPRGANRSA
jgi:LuxR family maltose regulon positive regulatory protein